MLHVEIIFPAESIQQSSVLKAAVERLPVDRGLAAGAKHYISMAWKHTVRDCRGEDGCLHRRAQDGGLLPAPSMSRAKMD